MVTFAGLESDLALAHPELLEPWDGTIERVRAGLHGFVVRKLPLAEHDALMRLLV